MALINLASKIVGLGSIISRGVGALFPQAQRNYAAFASYERAQSDPVSYKEEEVEAKKIIDAVKASIAENRSRNFAIVHVMGKQRRVTDGDLLIIEGQWPPTVGDQIRLEKVLLAGSADFTLIGRPLVQPGLVDVTATVVGKSLSTTRTHFRKKRRKQYMKIAFMKAFQTTLRINRVKIGSDLNAPPASVLSL